MLNKKILLGLTTTPGSDWREKIKEIDRLGIKEVAAFPTFLKPEERKELYALLEKTQLEKIPHVHLRDDMELEEMDYFFKRWQTQVFNIHPRKCFLKFLQEEKRKKVIFVENMDKIGKDFLELIDLSGGICLDFSHWQSRYDNRRKGYGNFEEILRGKSIGCCHISAVRKKWGFFWTDDHHFENLDDFDYLEKRREFFPDLISLELENPFIEQLKAKKYLEEKFLFG